MRARVDYGVILVRKIIVEVDYGVFERFELGKLAVYRIGVERRTRIIYLENDLNGDCVYLGILIVCSACGRALYHVQRGGERLIIVARVDTDKRHGFEHVGKARARRAVCHRHRVGVVLRDLDHAVAVVGVNLGGVVDCDEHSVVLAARRRALLYAVQKVLCLYGYFDVVLVARRTARTQKLQRFFNQYCIIAAAVGAVQVFRRCVVHATAGRQLLRRTQKYLVCVLRVAYIGQNAVSAFRRLVGRNP